MRKFLLVFCMSKLYFREFCLQCSDNIFYLTVVIYVYISLRPKIRFISEMSVENKTLLISFALINGFVFSVFAINM